MSRIPGPNESPAKAPGTSPSRIPGRWRQFPWWVFLPVGLCLCSSVAAFVWLSTELQQQKQASVAAQATANALPTQFDHAPGFGVITATPEPRTAARAAILAATQTAQVAVARSLSLLAATETAVAFATASAPIATPPIINPDYTASASVNPDHPVTPNGNISVAGKLSKRGQAVQGAIMSVTLGNPSKDAPINGTRTQEDGTAIQTLDIGQVAADVKVPVDISFYVDGQLVVRTSSSFTPRK